MKHRKSPRLKWYDYRSSWAYFVTICTQDREHCFGEVRSGKMELNELGIYTTEHWNHISDHYPFVICDAFVCMPNHIHGILIIGERNDINIVGMQFLASCTSIWDTSDKRTYKNTSLQSGIQPTSWSLWSIVRWYKIWITKYAKQHNIPFKRQSRYHDHIIRGEKSYNNIAQYI